MRIYECEREAAFLVGMVMACAHSVTVKTCRLFPAESKAVVLREDAGRVPMIPYIHCFIHIQVTKSYSSVPPRPFLQIMVCPPVLITHTYETSLSNKLSCCPLTHALPFLLLVHVRHSLYP
jgi:hypothetical protein